MIIKERVGKIVDGLTAIAGQSVAVRSVVDGSPLNPTLTTDTSGYLTLQRDGNLPPFYFHISDVPGGDKYWRSDDSHQVGAWCPRELPLVLRAAGDGVVRGYGGELAGTLIAGPAVTIAAGSALVVGTPVVQYSTISLGFARPVSSTRVDRVVIRLYPEGSTSALIGKADLVLVTGVEGAGSPALTQTADLYELPLYSLSIPVAGTITLTDERYYGGEFDAVTGSVTADGATTTSAPGALLAAVPALTLTLPRPVTYDITARLAATQYANLPQWVLQATYGPSLPPDTLSSPAQVATTTFAGELLVANTGAATLELLFNGAFSSRITGLTSITGVCTDASSNVYVFYYDGSQYRPRKYNASFALQWTGTPGTATAAGFVHLATNGTELWITYNNVGGCWVYRYNASTGAFIANLSITSGFLWGIAYNSSDGFMYMVDNVNGKVHVYNPATLAFVRQFSIPVGCRGIAIGTSGNLLIAGYAANVVYRYTTLGVLVDSFSQATPEGVAVMAGEVVWASNVSGNTIAKWDESTGGHGQVAIRLAGASLSSYVGAGDRTCGIGAVHKTTAVGPTTVSVEAFGKATSGQMSLQALALSAKAVPRR